KVDPASTDPYAMKARALIETVRRSLAAKFRLDADKLPMRRRSNSTSVVFFARMEVLTGKRSVTFAADGQRCGIEFLAAGQQVVITGHHTSGGIQSSNLASWNLDDLPLVSEADVDELLQEFRAAGEKPGYGVDVPSRRTT